MPHGVFVWNELNSRNVERAKHFYAETLGWSFQPMANTGKAIPYWIAKSGDRPVAGVFDVSDPFFDDIPEGWLPYIDVDDVDRRIEAAKSAGGRVMREPWDIPGVGRIAILREPGGVAIGWMTARPLAAAAAAA